MKTKYPISRWVYPLFLGIVMFNFLRLTTDLLKDNSFWVGSLSQHLISQLSILIMCYLFDYRSTKALKKQQQEKYRSLTKEYISVIYPFFIGMNVVVAIGEYIGIYYMGNGFIDYVILNVICIPLLLLYYVMIRNDIMKKEYIEQSLLLEQIKNKQLETELDYLKAQYHPHFLFNALNTVYFQIDEKNTAAKETVEILSELLRYQLYDVSKVVTIDQELDFINNYIRFQQLRVSKRLQMDIQVDPSLKDMQIHPLLFQPLLENAFKYVGGEYLLHIDIRRENDAIRFSVENSVSELLSTSQNKSKGIGIENLKRRLALLYPDKHKLTIERKEKSFFAELVVEI